MLFSHIWIINIYYLYNVIKVQAYSFSLCGISPQTVDKVLNPLVCLSRYRPVAPREVFVTKQHRVLFMTLSRICQQFLQTHRRGHHVASAHYRSHKARHLAHLHARHNRLLHIGQQSVTLFKPHVACH
ncbi:MAG: hypothetical protein IJR13_10210 [Bacteroidales bacterium]|nr:hypothetical protein [Bacteroidales bacterium]